MLDWFGCYDGGWKGLIVPEAFAHPAKFSYRLIQRIYAHGLKEGYWKVGDTIGDPFGGVGLGGICAAYAGLRWKGVELEKRFWSLAHRNFALHDKKWLAIGDPLPTMMNGDSRNFASLVGCDGIVTSPPYAEGLGHGGEPTITGGRNVEGQQEGYGTTTGQIGSLPAGKLDAVVTSPPWETVTSGHDEEFDKVRSGGPVAKEYGESAGQIGNDTGETYWQAVKTVYEQCRLAMKPGGIIAMVVKDYVKAGKRVPLCDQTCSLLESLGFDVFERCRAWLVKEETNPGLFGEVTDKTERKSFFRRLAEKKGSPRIDWEEVIWARG